MKASSGNSYRNTDISEITTYQSGVAQSSAFRMVKLHTATLLKKYDLTSMQWFIIGTVYDAGKDGIRVSDLATKLDTTMAFMTTSINLLESRGIFEKKMHKTDARTKQISVSRKYRRTCLKIEEDLREYLRATLYDHISREELSVYINVLYKLSRLDPPK